MMLDETTPNRTTPTSARATHAMAEESAASHSIRPTPRANGGSRPRTPASASAVRDGRNLLAQFRHKKRRDVASPHATAAAAAAAASAVAAHTNGSSGPLAAKSTGGKSAIDYVAKYASRAPGIARNLEAALDASLANRRNTDETDGGGVVGGEGSSSSGDASDVTPKQAAMHSAALNGGPSGDAVGPSDGEILSEYGVENSSDGDASVAAAADNSDPDADASTVAATATADGEILSAHGVKSSDGVASVAAATDNADPDADAPTVAATAAAVASTKPSPPREDAIISSSDRSPALLTPEVLRQEARTSQAAFLSSVLPEPDLNFDAPPSASAALQLTPPIAPNDGRSGTATDDGTGATISSSDAAGSDKQAVARWASMRRLQEQSVGLGSAADHQLTRALQICRDLRGLKNGVGGGNLSGNERASRLDALQSTLHGLQEVLAKRNTVEKAARVEAGALGGPAVLTSLSQGGHRQTQPGALVKGEGGGAVADTGGWLSGSQLKAFEEEVHARSSMEISALQSERRKLRSKVEMFQRQVQLLQREGATLAPAAANGGSSRIGASPMREGDVNGFGSAAGDKRFADLLDARLGEERHVQATLEAELKSLRGSLEEKDGLIGALREALRSAATTEASGGGATAATADADASRTVAESKPPSSPADQKDGVVENTPAPRSADGRAVVPGRGVFAPLSDERNRSHGRYHSRSSRLMGAQGPVAATGAAARHAAGAPRGGPWSESLSADGGGGTREDELRTTEGGRWGAPNGDRADSVERASSSAGGDVATSGRRGSSDGTAADSGVAFPSRNVTPPGAKGRFGAAASGRVNPSSVSRRRDGDGYTGIISQATAVTGTALRSLWESARVVGSKVGLDGAVGSESPRNNPVRRGNSSHAVLIL